MYLAGVQYRESYKKVVVSLTVRTFRCRSSLPGIKNVFLFIRNFCAWMPSRHTLLGYQVRDENSH